MKWKRVAVLLALGLGLSCAEGGSVFVGDDVGPGDGPVTYDISMDGLVTDGESPDLQPGVIDELAEGQIATLGGPASATVGTFEGKPEYELEADGLEFAGIHGAQCSADIDLCITEGGIAP